MQPPTTTTTASATTYTTIPISGADVIFRSFQNLSNLISRHRPWPEFIAAGIFDRPESLSGTGIRLRQNAKYFSINYGILIATCAAVSLIGNPIALIAIASVFTLWLVLHFFREDPMVVWGHHVSDRIVMVVLVLITAAAAIWFTGIVNNLLIGVAIGVLISAVHGVLRNPEGLFLDENDAVYNGLIGSPPSSSPHIRNFPS